MKRKIVTGIFDTNIIPLNIGGILLFTGELLCQKIETEANRLTLQILSDKHIPAYMTKIAEGIAGMDDVSVISGKTHQAKRPDEMVYLLVKKNYQSTRVIQQFFVNFGYIPYLHFKKIYRQWAEQFKRNVCHGAFMVVVHLKNDQQSPNLGNADFGEWLKFFQHFIADSRFIFVLIGNEPLPDAIGKLPNVKLAREFGSHLARDLALIEQADLFMGVTSGPANMAILSQVPYLIYKHPRQHTSEMKQELGTKDHFLFATPLQKFYRAIQQGERLIKDFSGVYSRLNL